MPSAKCEGKCSPIPTPNAASTYGFSLRAINASNSSHSEISTGSQVSSRTASNLSSHPTCDPRGLLGSTWKLFWSFSWVHLEAFLESRRAAFLKPCSCRSAPLLSALAAEHSRRGCFDLRQDHAEERPRRDETEREREGPPSLLCGASRRPLWRRVEVRARGRLGSRSGLTTKDAVWLICRAAQNNKVRMGK